MRIIALPANHAMTQLAGEQIREWEVKPASDAHPGSTAVELADAGVKGLLSPALSSKGGEGEAPGAITSQILEVQFIKPLEKEYVLTLFSEQTVEATPGATSLTPPQPMDIERESGSFTIAVEDTVADVDSATGLRQVNAPAGSLASYRFNGRPFALAVNLRRIEPVVTVAEHVNVRIQATRLVYVHTLDLNIDKDRG